MSRPRLAARRFTRAAVTLEVQYRTAGSFLLCYSQNLSKGGLFLETPDLHPVGTTLQVRFAIPGVTEPMTAQARVMWVRQRSTADEHGPGLGLAFDQVDAHIGDRIDDLVRSFSGVTLMAVADEQALDRYSRQLCGVLTCSVLRATSPRIATALLSAEIDLVLLDFDAFGSASLPLIEATRAHVPPIPLVAATRDWQEGSANPVTAVGAAAVLQNPPRQKELRQTILELLARPANV